MIGNTSPNTTQGPSGYAKDMERQNIPPTDVVIEGEDLISLLEYMKGIAAIAEQNAIKIELLVNNFLSHAHTDGTVVVKLNESINNEKSRNKILSKEIDTIETLINKLKEKFKNDNLN